MMKSSVPFSESAGFEITCSHVLEHCFCPRFTYFEHVLAIPERQEKRFKVVMGREVHERAQSINKSYLRKKIGCIDRRFNVYLSTIDGLIGQVDEVLTLDDNTMAPLYYKFAEYPGYVYKTHKLQAAFYARLIEESYGSRVTRAFLVFTRSNNKLAEVPLGEEAKTALEAAILELRTILGSGRLPDGAASRTACRDCCYRNICV